MFEKKKCKNCASFEKLVCMREQKDRAEDAAVALENRLAELQARFDEVVESNKELIEKNEGLELKIKSCENEVAYVKEKLESEQNQRALQEDDYERMREVLQSLRARIYTLLKRTDVDAEIFNMPKYTMIEAQTITADPNNGVIYGPENEARPIHVTVDCIYYNHGWCNSVDSIYQKCAGDCEYRREI